MMSKLFDAIRAQLNPEKIKRRTVVYGKRVTVTIRQNGSQPVKMTIQKNPARD